MLLWFLIPPSRGGGFCSTLVSPCKGDGIAASSGKIHFEFGANATPSRGAGVKLRGGAHYPMPVLTAFLVLAALVNSTSTRRTPRLTAILVFLHGSGWITVRAFFWGLAILKHQHMAPPPRCKGKANGSLLSLVTHPRPQRLKASPLTQSRWALPDAPLVWTEYPKDSCHRPYSVKTWVTSKFSQRHQFLAWWRFLA